MIRYVLPGSIRSKKNSKILTSIGGVKKPRRVIILPSKAYQKWEREAKKAAIIQTPPHKYQISGPVHVKVTAFYKGQRPDLAGVLESVGDCLEGLAYADDKNIVSWDGSRLFKDNDNPGTIVEVEKAEKSLKESMEE